MYEIEIPFPLKGLSLKPEQSGRLKLDEKAIQTLATLFGWDGEGRRLLTCALNGALQTTSPQAKAILNRTSSGANEDFTFGHIPTSEVLILANPNNAGDIWLNIGTDAAVDKGWVLDAGDFLNISVNNLRDLEFRIITSGDKLILIYTV